MKYPEYDSPFELVMSDITTQMARNLEEMCWNAVQRVGIDVDKEKLLMALRQDSKRYCEAYAKGYDTGYEKRDDDIVRCKDCKRRGTFDCPIYVGGDGMCSEPDNWFCADGEQK